MKYKAAGALKRFVEDVASQWPKTLDEWDRFVERKGETFFEADPASAFRFAIEFRQSGMAVSAMWALSHVPPDRLWARRPEESTGRVVWACHARTCFARWYVLDAVDRTTLIRVLERRRDVVGAYRRWYVDRYRSSPSRPGCSECGWSLLHYRRLPVCWWPVRDWLACLREELVLLEADADCCVDCKSSARKHVAECRERLWEETAAVLKEEFIAAFRSDTKAVWEAL